jgi:hypothetical protein
MFLQQEARVIGADGYSHEGRLYNTLSAFGSQLSAAN